MPVAAYPGPDSHVGNGVTTVFAYSYRILDETDLVVTVDGALQTLTTHYTVAGEGDAGGGSIAFLTAPANLTAVIIQRLRPYERDEDYQRNGSFDEETVDGDFDSLEMQIQQLAAGIARAFKPPVEVTADQVLTPAQWAARAGLMLGFDGSGNFGVFAALDSADPASAYILTLLDDANAAAARVTLGFPAVVSDGEAIITESSGLVMVGQYPQTLAPNPFFQVNQRQGSSLTDDVYGPDRWYALTQTGAIAYALQTDQENGQPHNVRLTQSQATAQRFGLATIIEGKFCKHLRGQQVTFRPRVRISASQVVRMAVLEWTGTEDAVTSDVVNDWTSASYAANAFFLAASVTVTGVGAKTPPAATWTDMDALTVTLGSSFNNLVLFVWTEAVAAQNVTLDIGKVRFVRGPHASNIHMPSFDEVLRHGQRYLWKTFPYATAPAQVGGEPGELTLVSPGVSGNNIAGAWKFPVQMRSTPTLVTYNPATAASTWRDYTSGADRAVNGPYGLDQNGFGLGATGVTLNAQNSIHASAVIEL